MTRSSVQYALRHPVRWEYLLLLFSTIKREPLVSEGRSQLGKPGGAGIERRKERSADQLGITSLNEITNQHALIRIDNRNVGIRQPQRLEHSDVHHLTQRC